MYNIGFFFGQITRIRLFWTFCIWLLHRLCYEKKKYLIKSITYTVNSPKKVITA